MDATLARNSEPTPGTPWWSAELVTRLADLTDGPLHSGGHPPGRVGTRGGGGPGASAGGRRAADLARGQQRGVAAEPWRTAPGVCASGPAPAPGRSHPRPRPPRSRAHPPPVRRTGALSRAERVGRTVVRHAGQGPRGVARDQLARRHRGHHRRPSRAARRLSRIPGLTAQGGLRARRRRALPRHRRAAGRGRLRPGAAGAAGPLVFATASRHTLARYIVDADHGAGAHWTYRARAAPPPAPDAHNERRTLQGSAVQGAGACCRTGSRHVRHELP
ncbi:hypothetical protein QJS66_11350 [Kocuria rhizophila]|nr:hypothetical protein QJS66_11350 [Kocuria rhizophila]